MEVPNEVVLEVSELFADADVTNLSGDEEISEKTTDAISRYESTFSANIDDWSCDNDGIWNLADSAFRCSINNASVEAEKRRGANKGDDQSPRARQASTLFHRHVTQKAANGYAVQASKELPFKYETIVNESGDGSELDGEAMSRQMNTLAQWTMNADRFKQKTIEFWTQVMKYGNIPVMVEWKRQVENRTRRVPNYDAEGNITYTYESRDIITANYPELKILPIESILADVNIGNIQDQECVISFGLNGIGQIIDGIESGIYRDDLLEELNTTHMWDGYAGFNNREEKNDNRDVDVDATNTGKYLLRDVFVNLPISEEGDDSKWDEKKNQSVRYRVTLIGNDVKNSVVARIERNQEPDDTIPIEMIHANPDDGNLLYHISMYEVLRSNLSTSTTLMRQAIDNNALVNDAPLVEVEGAVKGNDRTFGPKARFIVSDSVDSIKKMDVPSTTSQTVGLLEYVNEDSNTANSFDKNMLGESFGARTSATEAQTIAGNTNRPNLVNVQYILDQFLRFYAERIKVQWSYYGLPNQYIQITDEKDRINRIKPWDIEGEFDITIDVVDDVLDNVLKIKRIDSLVTTAAQNPEFAQQWDWNLVANDYSDAMFGTDKYVKKENPDAEQSALQNVSIMYGGGQAEISEGMDFRTHLRLYKAALLELAGTDTDTAPFETAIAEIEAMMAGGAASAPAQQQTQGQETGGQIAGELGAAQQVV